MQNHKTAIVPGSKAPEFVLPDSTGAELRLSSLAGKWVVVYFYPKDNTPGCTTEALEFSQLSVEFDSAQAVVLGISPDSVKSHNKFVCDHGLTVRLLSDPEHKVLEVWDAWKQKSQYGRQYMGVERSTVLVSPDGTVAWVWPKVKAAGHASIVLDKIRQLAGA